jgi:hypothetical protein
MMTEWFNPSWLTGPYGGIIAVAFAAGAVGGWGFAARTILKIAQTRMTEMKAEMLAERVAWAERTAEVKRDADRAQEKCEQRISQLERRQLELEDMLLGRRSLGAFSTLRIPQDTPPDMIGRLDEIRRSDEGNK